MSTSIVRGKSARSCNNCSQVLRVLQSYLDGVLDERTAAQVARHLEGCRPCVLEAGTYLAIKSVLSRRGQHAPTAARRLHAFGQTLLDEADESSPREGSFGG